MEAYSNFVGYASLIYLRIQHWHIFGSIRVVLFFTMKGMRKIVIHSASAELRALIRGLLSDIDALFVPTASREELFRICKSSHCDLVLTDDVRMFLNGSDAIARIRIGGASPQIFVLSHDLSEEIVTALLEIGVNQFINLPVAPERLHDKIAAQSIMV